MGVAFVSSVPQDKTTPVTGTVAAGSWAVNDTELALFIPAASVKVPPVSIVQALYRCVEVILEKGSPIPAAGLVAQASINVKTAGTAKPKVVWYAGAAPTVTENTVAVAYGETFGEGTGRTGSLKEAVRRLVEFAQERNLKLR